jgi:hypothetical protein
MRKKQEIHRKDPDKSIRSKEEREKGKKKKTYLAI